MNTTTMNLPRSGYFNQRSVFDWAFAVLVLIAGAYGFQRYAASMDVYEKAILIGKGGAMLKRIGTLARQDIVKLLESRVHLALFVKVEADWSRTMTGLRRAGFDTGER